MSNSYDSCYMYCHTEQIVHELDMAYNKQGLPVSSGSEEVKISNQANTSRR
jgi:hypothetical protein